MPYDAGNVEQVSNSLLFLLLTIVLFIDIFTATCVEIFTKISYLFCSLRPSTQKVLALAAEVQALKKDKEHLRINLQRAEEEVSKLINP